MNKKLEAVPLKLCYDCVHAYYIAQGDFEPSDDIKESALDRAEGLVGHYWEIAEESHFDSWRGFCETCSDCLAGDCWDAVAYVPAQ